MLCSDAHIAQLNEQWRGKAEATDVLSFPMEQDSGDGCPVRMLGDLVISLDTARRQAQERGCALLTMHAPKPSCSGLPSAVLCSACWATLSSPWTLHGARRRSAGAPRWPCMRRRPPAAARPVLFCALACCGDRLLALQALSAQSGNSARLICAAGPQTWHFATCGGIAGPPTGSKRPW